MRVVVESRKLRLLATGISEGSVAAFAATDKILRLTVFPSGVVA